jgi:DNA recombination-dependent growth factor C
MFRNLRFYRITNSWPKTEQKLSEVLSENAFSPCGAFSERSAGWEAPAIKEALEEKCIGIIDRLFRRSQQPAMTQFLHHSQTRPWTERVPNWF